MADVEKFNWRLTAVWWLILFVGAMCLMLTTAVNKTIVIADSTENGVNGSQALEVVKTLCLEETEEETGTFWIPLKSGTKAGNVVVENSYLDRELRIFIGGADAGFYEENAVRGNVDFLKSAVSKTQKSGVLLCFQTNQVYEFQTSMDQDVLKVVARNPQDLYDMVVVVDPAASPMLTDAQGAIAQEELTMAVSRYLSEQWTQENIKLYYTRLGDRQVTDDQRVKLAQDTDADIYIRLAVSQEEDPMQYGISGRYNQAYFIPGFGNVELADILTRNVTIATNNRAVGLVSTEEEDVLNRLQIPSACIEMGYVTNEQECELLASDSYRQKLAGGIIEGIKEVYTSYYEKSVQ